MTNNSKELEHFNKGFILCNKGEYNEAIKEYDKELELNNKDWKAYHDRGMCKAALGKFDDAILDFEQALRINGDDYLSFVNIAQCKHRLNKLDDAELYLKKAIKTNPEIGLAYFTLSQIKTSQKKFHESLKLLDLVIKKQQKNASVYFERGAVKTNLGLYKESLKDYTKGIVLLQRIIKSSHSKSDIYVTSIQHTLAELYHGRGFSKFHIPELRSKAKADFDIALKIYPDFPMALNNRAILFQDENSLPYLNRAIDLNKDKKYFHNRSNIKSQQGDETGSEIDIHTCLMMGAGQLGRYDVYKETAEKGYRVAFIQLAKKVHYESDKVFYSFRKFAGYSLDEIANNYISFSSPKINDPNDSPIIRDIERDNDKTKFFERIHVRCFSHVPNQIGADSKELSNTLLWSHYADGHKGFAIGYSFKRSLFSKNPELFLGKVNYSDSLNYYKEDKFILETGLLEKGQQWEYENEYRLINLANQSDIGKRSIVYYEADIEVVSITFGINSSLPDRKKLYELLSEEQRKKIVFYIIKDDTRNRFSLLREEYNFDAEMAY
jgi:tetratricopeptide (TPR) repeat protein